MTCVFECFTQILDVLTDIVESTEKVDDTIISAWHGTYRLAMTIFMRKKNVANRMLTID